MYLKISKEDFRRKFQQRRPDNFSYVGLGFLYDYLSQVEIQNEELDVIDICCSFEELTLEELKERFEDEIKEDETDEDEDEDEIINKILLKIEDIVISVDKKNDVYLLKII